MFTAEGKERAQSISDCSLALSPSQYVGDVVPALSNSAVQLDLGLVIGMQIEIGLSDRRTTTVIIILIVLFALIGLGFLGWAVTPAEAGEAVTLTPDRWQAAVLARKAARRNSATPS